MVWDPADEDLCEELEPVYYDVPAHLRDELWTWTQEHISRQIAGHGSKPLAVLANAMRLDPSQGSYEQVRLHCLRYPAFQLRAIRALLKHIPSTSKAGELEKRLKRGNSGYAVTADLRGLEFRVPPAAREEVEHAVAEVTESVSQLLTKAWNAAYGIDARPDDAFTNAFKAAEAALRPAITPDDAHAGLNKLITAYDAKPSKWEGAIVESRATFDPNKHTALNSADTVIQMARTVAYGQKSRHGQDEDANSVTEARTAVHLAIGIAMAVHEGAFRRVPTQ